MCIVVYLCIYVCVQLDFEIDSMIIFVPVIRFNDAFEFSNGIILVNVIKWIFVLAEKSYFHNWLFCIVFSTRQKNRTRRIERGETQINN